MNIIPNDIARCAGEMLGDDWGHPDHVCEVRESCARYRQFLIDHRVGADRVVMTGWACSDDSREFYIKSDLFGGGNDQA